MNLIEYLLMWIRFGEKPPKEVLLTDSKRKPTQSEIEYGKTLENEANRLKTLE